MNFPSIPGIFPANKQRLNQRLSFKLSHIEMIK